jgi:SAM-dependent methyltransferase
MTLCFRVSVACFRVSVACFRGVLPCLCALSAIATLPAQTRTPDVHFTPTRHAIADAMLGLARVTADDVVYDLGSGDGRIPIIAAQKYGARGVGIDIDGRLIAIARQHAHEGGVEDKVTFIEGDLFTADISAATVVTLYLSASMNARLEGKLKRELRAGARIVSHQFPIGHWTPDERTRVDFSELFLWTIRH